MKADHQASSPCSDPFMKHHKIIVPLVAVYLLLVFSTALAKDYETYRGEISIPIVENDTVLARNNAFHSLQNLLLSAAIQDLIGPTLYQEYQYQISKNNTLEASRFLVSAKVLNERSEDNLFTMELEGRIQISTLSDVLRGMNLVLKEDPWFTVTVIMESALALSPDDLKRRLGLFHIMASNVQLVDLEGIPWQERSKADFIEALFQQYSSSGILYFIDTITDDEGYSVKGIRNQVFRRSDLSLLDSFQLDIPIPKPMESLDESTLDRFLRLYSITSIDVDHYEEGVESTLFLRVEGLISPYEIHQFEEKILKTNRSLKSFVLVRKATGSVEYQVKSKHDLNDLLDFFNRKNSQYYFITEKVASNILLIEAFDRSIVQVTDLLEWDMDQRILDMITETIQQEGEEATSDIQESLFGQSLPQMEYTPRLLEKEPNNNSQNLNKMPPDSLVLGNISSRADEDLYQISRDSSSSTLVVEWLQIGKTTLSPQLRLYDDSFSFVNNFRLSPSKEMNKYQYTFKEQTPHKLYLRITDRIGFIQGETGGFKSFYYLLRYYWQPDEKTLSVSN